MVAGAGGTERRTDQRHLTLNPRAEGRGQRSEGRGRGVDGRKNFWCGLVGIGVVSRNLVRLHNGVEVIFWLPQVTVGYRIVWIKVTSDWFKAGDHGGTGLGFLSPRLGGF